MQHGGAPARDTLVTCGGTPGRHHTRFAPAGAMARTPRPPLPTLGEGVIGRREAGGEGPIVRRTGPHPLPPLRWWARRPRGDGVEHGPRCPLIAGARRTSSSFPLSPGGERGQGGERHPAAGSEGRGGCRRPVRGYRGQERLRDASRGRLRHGTGWHQQPLVSERHHPTSNPRRCVTKAVHTVQNRL